MPGAACARWRCCATSPGCTPTRSTSTLLAERLGLGDCGRTPYRRLSGGQQQRLGLAMALVGRPEVVFVDEPTAGMDPQVRRTTWELLEELRADGVTVVLTTHYMDEAERLADRIHIIDRGRLVASGTPLELMRGGTVSTIRLVVTEPFPSGAPESLKAVLGPQTDVSPARRAAACSSPAPPTPRPWQGLPLVRGERRRARVAHPGPAQPRGRLPRADRTGAAAVSGTFAPRPGAAPFPRQVLAQASMEARLMLRNGEQLLLAVVIPVIVLIGGVPGADRVGLDFSRPAVDVLTPGRARAGGDVDGVHLAGDRHRLRAPLRRDQATGHLTAVAHRAAGRQGRRAAAGRGAPGRGDRGRRLVLGWDPDVGPSSAPCSRCVLGTAAFASLGLLLAGALRAEATLAAANLVYLLLMAGGAVVLPLSAYGGIRRGAPLAALGSPRRCDALGARATPRCAWRELAVLAGWAVVGAGLTARTFKWE